MLSNEVHMGGNCVRKDHFLLKWGQKMIDSCKDLDEQIIPYLQKELIRVMEPNSKTKVSAQAKKSPAFNVPRIQNSAKCVARKCLNKNVLDVGNVGAFGIYFKCGESEHFRCAGTKDDEKKDIIEGYQNYICFKCLLKKHIALVCENNVPKITNTVTTIAQINPIFECNLCDYTGDGKKQTSKTHGRYTW